MPKKLGMQQEQQLEFINITSDDKDSTVKVYLRGEFPPPELCASEMTTLSTLSDQFDTVEFYINSPGGSADTLIELITIKEKFKNSIGIVTGQASSAGSLLWASCDLRVVHDYASLMMHRESFIYGGKTKHHLDHARHSEELFGKMSVEIFADVLTEAELNEITHSELYFTAEQMIERGAISYSQFLERGSVEAREVSLVIYDEVVYMRSAVDGMLYPVTEFNIDEETPLSEVSVKYGLVEFEEDSDEDDDSLDSFGDGYTDADFEVVEENDAELIDDYDQFEKTMTEQYGNKADV
jgi:ATP-dependent protease ClpP protease subunit